VRRRARYNDATLDVTYKGKTIADVLEMEVEEAADFFESNSQIRRRLELLQDVGLGYMTLGQPSTTPSRAARPSGSNSQKS